MFEAEETKSTAATPKVVFEVGALGVEVVRQFGCYRMPESMRLWVYQGGQVVVETSGRVDLASAVQISQRCRDVSSRLSRVSPFLSDYVLRPEVPLTYAAVASSKLLVSRTGYIRPPYYYNLEILEGGDVVITTGGLSTIEQRDRLISSCRLAGFEEVRRVPE